jgi:hypothetical protein
MRDVPIELIISIFEYIQEKDILVSLTKSLFHLRHFFQIQVNEKIILHRYSNVSNVKLYKHVCINDGSGGSPWKNIRAKKVEIRYILIIRNH